MPQLKCLLPLKDEVDGEVREGERGEPFHSSISKVYLEGLQSTEPLRRGALRRSRGLGRGEGQGGCGVPAPLCPTDCSVVGATPVLPSGSLSRFFQCYTCVGCYICICTYECACIMSVYSREIT